MLLMALILYWVQVPRIGRSVEEFRIHKNMPISWILALSRKGKHEPRANQSLPLPLTISLTHSRITEDIYSTETYYLITLTDC